MLYIVSRVMKNRLNFLPSDLHNKGKTHGAPTVEGGAPHCPAAAAAVAAIAAAAAAAAGE